MATRKRPALEIKIVQRNPGDPIEWSLRRGSRRTDDSTDGILKALGTVGQMVIEQRIEDMPEDGSDPLAIPGFLKRPMAKDPTR